MKNLIDAAFSTVKRSDFVPAEMKEYVSQDRPIPIGHRQTNSQPSTVRMMLEWLKPEVGDSVLDIGSGSGWTTALLAEIVGPTGHVYGVERIAELVEMGKQNCQKYEYDNVTFHLAGASYGLPQRAPFDKILVSASADTFPEELLDQLKPDGRLVVPVQNDIVVISKQNDVIHTDKYPGFVFVPLV